MGKEKQTTSGSTSQQTTYTPTPEERELQKLYLERERAAQPGMLNLQSQGMNLVNALLTGQPLSGYLNTAVKGISPEAMGYQVGQSFLKDFNSAQSMGLSDSGTVVKEAIKNAVNNVLFPAEQFNIGAIQNALNLALSGQAQVQQPVLAQGSSLLSNLAGLRSISSTGTSSQRATTSYDFFTSPFTSAFLGVGQGFAQGLGTGIGSKL